VMVLDDGEPAGRTLSPRSPPRLNLTGIAVPAFATFTTCVGPGLSPRRGNSKRDAGLLGVALCLFAGDGPLRCGSLIPTETIREAVQFMCVVSAPLPSVSIIAGS
jgi:hypothetical protein